MTALVVGAFRVFGETIEASFEGVPRLQSIDDGRHTLFEFVVSESAV
jgi:hypothetical protein